MIELENEKFVINTNKIEIKIHLGEATSTSPDDELKQWSEGLNLKKIGFNRWECETPEGLQEVSGCFINGIPHVYYEKAGRPIATPAVTIDPKEITRVRPGTKKIWDDQI